MNFKTYSLTLVSSLISCSVFSQNLQGLKPQIDQVLANNKAKVGIAIHNDTFTDSLIINGDYPYPMQSTYKFHLAIAILDQVDKGKLTLGQPVEISKETVSTDLYSPIKDKYPNGTTLPLSEIIRYTVAESDNVGCDIMFGLLGGTEQVQKYFEEKGYSEQSIKTTEEEQQANWDIQFQNWTKVSQANKILFDYYSNTKKLLSDSSHKFLWDTMRSTSTGKDRLKGLLPQGTVVAHKTGYSGINKTTGIIAAVNDIGVIELPNGKVFYISVYVTDSKETEPNSAKIIAEVSKAAYDYLRK